MRDAGLRGPRYEVSLRLRAQHLVHVTVDVPSDVAEARLVLPSWTPGSYVVRDYAHHVQQVTATVDGEPAEVTDVDLSVWAVPAHAEGSHTRVAFEVYGHELTVRTNHIDDHHALLIPAATMPAVVGTQGRPHTVEVVHEASERAWGLLPEDVATTADATAFRAEDYLHLVDSAFEVGDFPHVTWEVDGVAHAFVWAAHGPAPDLDEFADDAAKLARACIDLFDELPASSYTFLHVGQDTGAGGLEHRDGAVLQWPLLALREPDRHAMFQSLVCHEYLHQWNVKRLTPAELVVPDLTRPTRTSLLWVAEGWTAYYDELLPVRCGLWDVERWLSKTAEVMRSVLDRPGALVQSVAQASRESWLKAYVRDENSVNVGVDYYGHGHLLAFCLDLRLRTASPERNGLDDAFRLLWKRFGSDDPDRPGYTTADVVEAVSEVAGSDMADFFTDYVEEAVPPPITSDLVLAGLKLTETRSPETPAWFGASVDDKGDQPKLTSVLRGGPAWEAGLSGGDVVLAIDGVRVHGDELPRALKGRDEGEEVEVTVFSGARLLTRRVTLAAPQGTWKLRPVDEPSAEQRAVFAGITGGQDLPG